MFGYDRTFHCAVQEYLVGELILRKLPQYYINWECAHSQLARLCMCYLSIWLDSPQANFNNTSADVDGVFSRRRVRLGVMSRPLRNYVLENAVDHFRHLGSQFKLVMRDIKEISVVIQRHSSLWDNLCRSARRVAVSRAAIWPTSKHDLALYILVAYAPNSFLRSFLRHMGLKPKEGSNPLVYAAYYNKEDHARTLLSQGARLNRRGWDVDGFFQVLPIEIALQTHHHAMVTFFVQEGSTIPSHHFTVSFFWSHLCYAPPSTIRMLLQTDDFMEAVNDPLNEPPFQLAMDAFNYLLKKPYGDRTKTYYEDGLTEILRRFIQVVDGHCQHNSTLLHSAIRQGRVSVAQYLLSLGASLPFDLHDIFRLSTLERVTAPMIRFLVENRADIHVRTPAGDPVLHATLRLLYDDHNALDIVKVLVSCGCDPLEVDSPGNTLLHIAVRSSLVAVTRYLLSLRIFPSPDLLHDAVRLHMNRTSMIICLLENGANIHSRDATGEPLLCTALQLFCSEDEVLGTAQTLIDSGCDPLATGPCGKAPLRIAVDCGFVLVVQYLISLGVSPTPDLLHVALELRDEEKRASMVLCLLENGFNVHAHTQAGGDTVLPPRSSIEEESILRAVKFLRGCGSLEANSFSNALLFIAVERGLVSLAKYLLSLDISPFPDVLYVAFRLKDEEQRASMIIHLLENGTSDIYTRDATRDTLLHTSLRLFLKEDPALKITKWLICHGWDPLEANSIGDTPLQIAVQQGLVSVTRYFLSLGISPCPAILHVAVRGYYNEQNRAPMVVCLLENGANIHVRTAAGDTVLHTALRSSRWKWSTETRALEVVKLLISHGCNPIAANLSGDTPLHIAVEHGLVSVARHLLSNVCSLPYPELTGKLLRIALKSENEQSKASMIVCLLENGSIGVDPSTATGDSVLHTPLQLFWSEGDALKIVKAPFSGSSCDAGTSGFEETLLHMAVKHGFVTVAQYLFSVGISPSPDLLHLVVGLEDDLPNKVQVIVCLLENGALAHTLAAESGDPLLHTALQSSSEEVALQTVKILVSHGCNPLEASSSGKNPLHIAVERGFVSVAQYFLSLGVPPSSDLLLAMFLREEEQKQSRILRRLESIIHTRTTVEDSIVWDLVHAKNNDTSASMRALRLLVGQGCNPLEPNSHGEIPLCVAVEQGRTTIARILLLLCAPPHSPCDVLWITLSTRQFRPKLQTINFLIDQGASVFAKAQNGETLLHVAVTSVADDEVLQVVSLLLGRGCDPTIPDDRGATPFHIAVKQGYISVVKLFLSLNVPVPPDIILTAMQSNPTLSGSASDFSARLEIMKILVNAGHDTRTRNAVGRGATFSGGDIDTVD